ncbi:uncharacterized protein FIESC28_00630 [Fusarium coffeatum]|uniref:Uncharacterized protein n=1 Tax=Fusarium coffeatum TaxID=231269 RepID=A0A366SB52_9HYPO|nr:uncharacterized protein FIESC28_00630 [Fusarium coffeatum]RBR26554.1 hypothetical protein FIESC28_00630 [Fusarium coffeatum]
MSQNDVLKRTSTYNLRSLHRQLLHSSSLCHDDSEPAPELEGHISTVDGLGPQSHIDLVPCLPQSKVVLSNDPMAGEDNVTLDYKVADFRDAWDRSKKSHESEMSVRDESFEPEAVPRTGLAPRINFVSATSLLNTPNLISAAIIVFFSLSPYIGHPAWILPTFSTSTANFTLPLTKDISHVHTTFRETVVPFRSRWEIDDLVKVTPWSFFLMLDIELDDVETGLNAWGHASIPGPDPKLRDQIRGLRRSIPVFQPSESDPWTPFAWACARVVEYTVRDSAARIFNAPTPAKKIDMISTYWYRMSRYNQNLIGITEALGSFIQGSRHTEEVLVQIRQQLLAQQDHPNYTIHKEDEWMPELLETIDYTLLHIVPQVKLFDDMRPPAIVKLKKLNQTISRQHDIWRQQKPIVEKGIVYEPKPWFPLVIGRSKVEETWSGVSPDELELMDDEGILGMASQRSTLQDGDYEADEWEKGNFARPRKQFHVRNRPRVKKSWSAWFSWLA